LFSSSNPIPRCGPFSLMRSSRFGMGRDSAIVPAGAAHRSTTGRAGPGEVPNLRLARQSRTGEAIQEWLTRTTGLRRRPSRGRYRKNDPLDSRGPQRGIGNLLSARSRGRHWGDDDPA
jgi:hypothetical protein